jgi:hypothetical protein
MRVAGTRRIAWSKLGLPAANFLVEIRNQDGGHQHDDQQRAPTDETHE